MNMHPQQPQTFPLPQGLTPKRREELYGEILRLYDLADAALAVVEREGTANRDIQMELLTPFITQVVNSANTLSAVYNEVVNRNLPITADLQEVFESAFRNIFYACKGYVDNVEEKLVRRNDTV